MANEVSITIDGVDSVFVRKDTLAQSIPMTAKRIIVAERGWIFVGDCEDHEDGSVTIHNAKNIRRWGTTAGLGELANGPTDNTRSDNYGTVRCTPIVSIAVVKGW